MNVTKNDPFYDVPLVERQTSVGPVKLPILYYDSSAVFAFYHCPKAAVESILEGTGLKPVLTTPGKAVAGIACFEYRDTSIGDYNEVGVAMPVRPKGGGAILPASLDFLRAVEKRTAGFYVAELPVTTEAACAAGREIWGYPKFVTGIDFSLEGDTFDCRVLDPDGKKSIVHLSGNFGAGFSIPPFSFSNYDQLGEQKLKTIVNVAGTAKINLPGSISTRIGESTHKMAETLRRLEIDRSRLLCLMVSNPFQSRLNEGSPI